ncbi:MAG: DUF1566 domain-containing protein [Proteobacteria bacterium]|nr:DUF1566 domain-containing protein [Pseudomonadota bacterium]
MKRIICLTMVVTLMMAVVAFAGTINLPRTGQTKCYDTTGTEIACSGTGQDGEIQAGVAWPDPRFTDNGDETMTDNLTGLMWTKDANLTSATKTWQQALDYVAGMNNGTYPNFGYADWRLPNVNELESLINANEPNSATWLNTQGFTNVQAYLYWSSTSDAVDQDVASIIDMWHGYVYNGDKSYGSFCFWPVHGGQQDLPDPAYPANVWKTGQTTGYYSGDDGDLERGVAWPVPRFADHGNGTVTDKLTGLMWTKDADLLNGTMTWQQALDYVAGMNTGTYPNYGFYDWRLPNRKELFSLADHSLYNPALPIDHPFNNVQTYNYWSSTSYTSTPDYANATPDYAAVILMWTGPVTNGGKSQNFYFWPVRGPETILNVDIDIKPGGFPNSINLKSKGNVPVAILSSPTFDASTVDRGTVEFAGAPALSIGGWPEDVNSDGLMDLVLHFSTQSLNLTSGDTEACLTGKTLSGQEFKGCDSVNIVK